LIRTIAGASRKLDEDLTLSPLQAIDRLQKIAAKFQAFWVGQPWLVLEAEADGRSFTIPAHMPVPKMLDEIAAHGAPVGLVGMALLPATRRYAVMQMMFRKDEKSRKAVERSAKAAWDILSETMKQIEDLTKRH
jgi:hypothetical protein